MKKDIFIYNELLDIADALKTPISITDITELNGVSTITTDTVRIFDNLCITMDLQNGMIVTINDINYQVSNIPKTAYTKTFDIIATDLIATQWNVAFNFQTGSREEINQILNQQSGGLDRFPLVWLIPPKELDYRPVAHDFIANITLVYAYKTEKDIRTAKSINENLSPIIQPLIKLFNKWLQSSDFNYMLDFFGHGKQINLKKSDYSFYGTSDKTKSVLNTIAGAIEVNYELTFKNQY